MSKLEKGSKILIANDSVGITGVQVSTKNIAKEMKKMGYKVVLLQPTDKEFLKITIPLEKQFKWTLFATPAVTKRILKEKPDAILITTVEAPIGKSTKDVCQTLESRKIAKHCPFTLMYTTNHGIYFDKTIDNVFFNNNLKTKQNLKKIEKQIIYSIESEFLKNRFSGAKRVLVNSESSKEKLLEIGINNVEVAPRGINLKAYHLPTSNDVNPYLQFDWYQSDPKPVLLYLGRVAFEKDIHLFLKGEYPDYHRVVAGPGPALNSLRREYGNNQHIHFIGAVPNENVPNYFMYARLSFFPSSFDTFGLTIIESAACGTPVVAYKVPGPKDVIKNGIMGITVQKENTLFDSLDKALEIDRLACSEYTRKKFSWKKSTKKILENLYPIKWGKKAK
jgi:glycosyltransferase involved in cell wall biosynthesis